MIKLFIQIGAMIITCLFIFSASAANKPEPLDRIIAVINDAVITQSELNDMLETIKKQMTASNVPIPTNDILHKQVLDQLINKKLQLQLAERMGIQVTEIEIDKAIQTIASNNKITVKELYEKIGEQGLSTHQYHKEIHDQIIIQQVQQQAVASKINISPQEVQDFLRSKAWLAFNTKEYHLEDILVALPENPSPQDVAAAKKHAEEILKKLQSGIKFNEVAAAESSETNALQGGDLGWRKLPEIPSAFSNELLHMKTNELLGPVQTPNGFHIVKLSGIRSLATKTNHAQQTAQIQELIFQRKLEEGLQSWMTKIRSEAYINTNPDKS